MYVKTTAIINADGPVDAQMELKLMQQSPSQQTQTQDSSVSSNQLYFLSHKDNMN